MGIYLGVGTFGAAGLVKVMVGATSVDVGVVRWCWLLNCRLLLWWVCKVPWWWLGRRWWVLVGIWRRRMFGVVTLMMRRMGRSPVVCL